MQILIVIVIIVVLLAFLLSLWPFILGFIGIYIIYRIIRNVRKNRYFNSEEFIQHTAKIEATIIEYNEISEYINNIPKNNQFIPTNNATDHSHLVTFENTSNHKYVRNRNEKTLNTGNIYSTSLQVVRKASEEPIKYLCKYFDIKATQDNLNQLQEIGNDISRMENTIENLQLRQKEIEDNLNPPKFILKHYHKELMSKIGVNIPPIELKYAQYIFEYVSAGGNSSQKSVIDFNGPTIEATSEYIVEKIKYKNSAKGQRALMTRSLRTVIKERDDYTCQMCTAAVRDQNLLLLEIDHIIPVSKGGMSTLDNLQTLCWKCNRTKSNKIL